MTRIKTSKKQTDNTKVDVNTEKDNIAEESLQDEMQQVAAQDDAGTEERERTQEEQAESEKKEAIKAIKEFTDEDDGLGEISLRAMLGGDILQSKFIRNQVLFVMFCVALALLYTGNRYSSQQDAIVIDSLRTKLLDTRYNVLTQNSELMNRTRQSNVEKTLRLTRDSLIKEATTPPYLIKTDSIR